MGQQISKTSDKIENENEKCVRKLKTRPNKTTAH